MPTPPEAVNGTPDGALTAAAGVNRPAGTLEAQLAEAYRPLHKSFLYIIGAYYAYVTIAHFTDETGANLLILASISALTTLLAAVTLWLIRYHKLPRHRVEAAITALCLFMLANVAAYQLLHYTPAKMVYYSLLAVAFGMAATSRHLLLVSVVASLGCMLATAWWFEPAALGTYLSIAVASGVVSIGVSTLLRGVIVREVAARMHAASVADEALAVSAENARLAKIDPLTGLPNRRHFFDAIKQQLARRSGHLGTVAGVLDLDGFKAINDLSGHTMGDYVLLEVAERLKQPGPPAHVEALVARIGGDEFGILLTGVASEDDIHTFAAALAERLSEPFRLAGVPAKLSGSTGFSWARADDTVAGLIERADYAAGEAKRHARGHALVFGPHHERSIVRERQMERLLLSDRLEQELYPVLQPIVEMPGRRTLGYEVLARWRSPQLGEVSPAEFVPLAERLGQVNRITVAMATHAARIARQLPADLRLSINLSPRDLAAVDDTARLLAALAAEGNVDRLTFEITETAMIDNIGDTNAALSRLRQLGARIALDDFGIGQSSLSRIHSLPLDCIKIDRSFVRTISEDETSRAILRAVLDLAGNLGLSCVIEGIEATEQLSALQAMGATMFQGYLFARPMPADEVLALHVAAA